VYGGKSFSVGTVNVSTSIKDGIDVCFCFAIVGRGSTVLILGINSRSMTK
jgi:hypothetical protein